MAGETFGQQPQEQQTENTFGQERADGTFKQKTPDEKEPFKLEANTIKSSDIVDFLFNELMDHLIADYKQAKAFLKEFNERADSFVTRLAEKRQEREQTFNAKKSAQKAKKAGLEQSGKNAKDNAKAVDDKSKGGATAKKKNGLLRQGVNKLKTAKNKMVNLIRNGRSTATQQNAAMIARQQSSGKSK